jgi:hypothetical protein
MSEHKEPLEVHHLNATKHIPNGPPKVEGVQVHAKKFVEESKSSPGVKEMGLGEMNDFVFVRKFRWTIESDSLNEWTAKNVVIDQHNKTIELELYEVVDKASQVLSLSFLELVKHGRKDKYTFTTYSGCGEELYKHVFENVSLEKIHPQEFDYASSEESTLKITLKYEDVKTLQGKSLQTSSQQKD